MRVFAGGISTETNTFSPVPTSFEDFAVQRGKAALEGRIDHPSLNLSETWGRQARAQGCEFAFGLMAWAMPSGITAQAAYERLRDELLNDLHAAMPVDVVLLNLHGSMVAQGYADCEEDIIRRCREVVGSGATIGVELDLHCNITEQKIACADVIVLFKEYPHTDANDRADELFKLALRAQRAEVRPTRAIFDCRMVGMYPTSRAPMRSVVDEMMDAERRERVLSISLAHGFQFADVASVGTKVLVITDNDPDLARAVAREFGLKVYAMRREIGFATMSLPFEQALIQANTSSRPPVVVADQSDNTGGGAPGDSTFVLRWLLAHKVGEVAMAIFYDPEVVRIARAAGVGARLSVRLGGKMGPASGDPVDLEVTVLAMREKYLHALPQRSGDPWYFIVGNVVALRCETIDLVVSSERCQCFTPSIFEDLGIEPKKKRMVVVKSYQHFYSGFAPIAGEVIYMAAPGAVQPDPRSIAYKQLNTSGLYPWTENPLEQAE